MISLPQGEMIARQRVPARGRFILPGGAALTIHVCDAGTLRWGLNDAGAQAIAGIRQSGSST
jgi:hypothetical protein